MFYVCIAVLFCYMKRCPREKRMASVARRGHARQATPMIVNYIQSRMLYVQRQQDSAAIKHC